MSRQIHFFQKNCKFRLEEKREIREWLCEVIIGKGRIPGDINIVFTSDNELVKFNIEYLNTDTFTDIITFTLSEEEKVISGDIYISIDRVRENAIKFKVKFDQEIRRVLVHGVLHLMGFSDSSVKEKRQMTTLENRYLKLYQGA